MKCNWCGKGKGKSFTKDKQGNVFYYYCKDCAKDLIVWEGFKIEEKQRETEI